MRVMVSGELTYLVFDCTGIGAKICLFIFINYCNITFPALAVEMSGVKLKRIHKKTILATQTKTANPSLGL